MKVRVVGSFVYDLIAVVDRRPAVGESVVGRHLERAVGGKGFNQAVAAARAGAQVEMVGCLGSDAFAGEFQQALAVEGIDGSFVRVVDGATTGVGLPMVEEASGANSIVFFPGANDALTAADVPALEEPALVLLQMEVPIEANLAAARAARAAGGLVVVNPAPALDAALGLAGFVDGVVLNEHEAAHFGGSEDPVVAARAALARWAAGWVAVTLGERGAVLVAGSEEPVWLEPFSVQAVDTVGAGDALCGVTCAALAEGREVREALERGMAAGAVAVTRRGGSPAMPTVAEVDEMLASRP